MPASVEETDDGVTVRVELPGVDPKLIDVQVAGDVLTIAVEETVGSGDGSAARPHRFGTFRQSITLPVPIDPNLTDARSENGVLIVELKRAADSMPKRIEVKPA
jgi:HSP20 family protein